MQIEYIVIIGLIFCLGFGIESIFGFAGTIISLAILGLFFDIKEMVALAVFAGSIASIYIFLSDYKSFKLKIYGYIMLFTIPGVILGTIFLKNYSSDVILYVFSGFLIAFAVYTIIALKFSVPRLIKPIIMFAGGILGGMFGTGGPFVIAALKDSFGGKSAMRTTLAAMFLTFNIIRGPIYVKQGILDLEKLYPFWWVALLLALTIWLGHKIHIKISERTFHIGVSTLLIIAGVSFLF